MTLILMLWLLSECSLCGLWSVWPVGAKKDEMVELRIRHVSPTLQPTRSRIPSGSLQFGRGNDTAKPESPTHCNPVVIPLHCHWFVLLKALQIFDHVLTNVQCRFIISHSRIAPFKQINNTKIAVYTSFWKKQIKLVSEIKGWSVTLQSVNIHTMIFEQLDSYDVNITIAYKMLDTIRIVSTITSENDLMEVGSSSAFLDFRPTSP